MKKILAIILVVTGVLGTFCFPYAEGGGELICSNITYEDGAGNPVTALTGEPVTAKITVTNKTNADANPVLTVTSFKDGKMNGIWYDTPKDPIPSGESAEVKVIFTPVSTESTEIEATLVDSLLSLNAPVATSRMLHNSTGLEALFVNGERVAEYSDDEDSYLLKVDTETADVSVSVADGGTGVDIKNPEKIPGIAEVSLITADGTERNIAVTMYNKEEQLYSLTGLCYEVDGVKYEVADFDPDVTSYTVQLPDNTLYATVVPEALSSAKIGVSITDRNLYAEGGKVAEDAIPYFLSALNAKAYVHRGTREAYNNLVPIKNEKTTATINVSAFGGSKAYTVEFTCRQPRLTHFALGDGNFPIEEEKPYFISGAATNNDNGTAIGADRNTWTLGGIPKDLVGASMISLFSVNGQRNTPNWQRTAGNENTKWCEFKADTPGTIYLVSSSIDGSFYTEGTGGWELATSITGAPNKLLKADGINMTVNEGLSGVYCFYACQWNAASYIVPYPAAQITNASLISGDIIRTGITYKKTFEAGELVEIYHPRKSPSSITAEAFIVWDLLKE